MCSNPAEPLADIERAINDLAALAVAAYASAGNRTASAPDDEQVVTRLAQLWTRLADMDPEVARRMPVYQASRLAATERHSER